MNNLLESHVEAPKLSAVYTSLACSSLELSSSISYIYLVALFKLIKFVLEMIIYLNMVLKS